MFQEELEIHRDQERDPGGKPKCFDLLLSFPSQCLFEILHIFLTISLSRANTLSFSERFPRSEYLLPMVACTFSWSPGWWLFFSKIVVVCPGKRCVLLLFFIPRNHKSKWEVKRQFERSVTSIPQIHGNHNNNDAIYLKELFIRAQKRVFEFPPLDHPPLW